MKVTAHEKTSLVYLEAETPKDHFVLGKLAMKIKGARTYNNGDNTLRLECDIQAFIDAAASAP